MFWEGHDPTQGMRQGNDVGTQYRSAIYTTSPAQAEAAEASQAAYAQALAGEGYGPVTTEIAPAGPVLFRRGLSPAVPGQEPAAAIAGWAAPGVTCPIGVGVSA